jgi:acyl carrier protein
LEIAVSARPAEIDTALSLVANALSVSVDGIGPETKMYDIPVWDSLGQLSIILAIEETLHVQITAESIFDSLTSIRGIATYLSKYRAD